MWARMCQLGLCCVGTEFQEHNPELFNNSHIWTFCISKVRRWTIPEEPHPLDRVRGRFTQNTHLAEGVLAYEVHSLQKPAHFIHSDKSYLIFIIVFIVTEPQGVAFRVIHLPKTCTKTHQSTEASHSESNDSDDFPLWQTSADPSTNHNIPHVIRKYIHISIHILFRISWWAWQMGNSNCIKFRWYHWLQDENPWPWCWSRDASSCPWPLD